MFPPSYPVNPPGISQYQVSQQQTLPYPAVAPFLNSNSGNAESPPDDLPPVAKKRSLSRVIALVLTLALGLALYFIWHPSSSTSSPPTGNAQNFGNTFNSSSSKKNTGFQTTGTSTSGMIQLYVVGSVKHPGVYTLPMGARVYQLLQAAGGPSPRANLVGLNLAAKLNDGQEVYITALGETPPTYLGGVPGPGGTTNGTSSTSSTNGTSNNGPLININTASVDEMRQGLHVSSTTAQNIINYRTQNGPFTSIDQLLQVVSKSIYDKVKGQITI